MGRIVNHENPYRPWEDNYWKPEAFWLGRTVYCMASGPSMSPEIARKVRGRPTIVVNSTALIAPWADVLYFTDSGWFETHREIISNWAGLVVTMSRAAKRVLDDPEVNKSGKDRVLRIVTRGAPPYPPLLASRTPGFPPPGTEIQQGRTSGHTAVALAIALGAKRVVLLGYDMRLVNGREHHHDDYRGPRDILLYEREYANSFAGWLEAACASGVDIVNCTPGSAIKDFRFADLDSILASDVSC